MALIKCPECGKEVSDKAEVCMNCGLSIKQYMIEKEYNENAKLYYCPKCGTYYCWGRDWTYKYEEAIKKTTCMYCKAKILELPNDLGLTPYFDQKGNQNKVNEIKKKFLNEYIMKQPEFDEAAYRKAYDLDPEPERSPFATAPRLGPQCPACGSTNTSKIGVLGRSTSIFAFGLASNKIGKNWKCKNCGHTW